MKKVGKTTRPFRYDLNHIPYDYTVEVKNRFKGLDLIECLMNTPIRKAKIKVNNINTSKDGEKLDLPHIAGGNIK